MYDESVYLFQTVRESNNSNKKIEKILKKLLTLPTKRVILFTTKEKNTDKDRGNLFLREKKWMFRWFDSIVRQKDGGRSDGLRDVIRLR